MSPEEIQLIRTAASDLEWLRNDWEELIDDDSLRRSSPVLRRLLIAEGTGDYSRAWRAIGFVAQPTLYAMDLDGFLAKTRPTRIAFGQAGGAEYNGITVAMALNAESALSPSETQAIWGAGPPTTSEYRLKEFLQSPSFVVGANPDEQDIPVVRVTRQHVIQYVANKLGGAHLDFTRENEGTQAAFLALDKIVVGGVRVADKNAVYYELLAIGQAVARSGNVIKFVNESRKRLTP